MKSKKSEVGDGCALRLRPDRDAAPPGL